MGVSLFPSLLLGSKFFRHFTFSLFLVIFLWQLNHVSDLIIDLAFGHTPSFFGEEVLRAQHMQGSEQRETQIQAIALDA